ncbi:MAG: 2-C-methyl-D-erythritol 2,4-cyclodiphosphate synthase [Treponema sp.]|jgi:2-C-methyl-D-erythritol 2,4-cyclodiphosphate synthase/2-C-methyl-D-erythritol 4-phosphate cytidylyltransferase/2-C-methyl-D-erythritol 2,4-cyclodiphosphate synthase|nr:2-C-methyl-D-erythritol 2,4-cyclodiphosphate synthase [Treponema sp.]
MFRTGIGYDIHRLKRGRRFLLAGVEIPFFKGEDGHSDGDVLAHAVCDAILGASAAGDIGELFPPNDPAWKNADSMELMQMVCALVKQAGWKIVNLDCVVICEKPKVLPFRDNIRQSLADTLEIPVECVFVKGKTAEKLGPAGKGKAVEAYTVCLLEKKNEEN